MKKYTVQVRILGKLYKRTIEARNEREAAEMVKSDIWKKIVIESVTEKEPPKPKPPPWVGRGEVNDVNVRDSIKYCFVKPDNGRRVIKRANLS